MYPLIAKTIFFTSLVAITGCQAFDHSASTEQLQNLPSESPSGSVVSAALNTSAKSSELVVATAIPVLASMLDELSAGTAIKSAYLPSPRYSIKRIPGWLARQQPADFEYADAVLGISSVWPSISLYPHLRQHNLYVVPIDAAQALVPGGERVALQAGTNAQGSYFWLNPANALVMLGISYRDLQALIEQSTLGTHRKAQSQQRLALNFQHISQSLRKVQTELDTLLADAPFMQISSADVTLQPLALASFLPLSDLDELVNGNTELPSLLITNKKPGHRSITKLAPNISVWHIDDFAKPRASSYSERWQANLAQLAQQLNQH